MSTQSIEDMQPVLFISAGILYVLCIIAFGWFLVSTMERDRKDGERYNKAFMEEINRRYEQLSKRREEMNNKNKAKQ